MTNAQAPSAKRLIIEQLYAAWLAAPDMRLGQLIVNAILPEAPVSVTMRLYDLGDETFGEVVEGYAAVCGGRQR